MRSRAKIEGSCYRINDFGERVDREKGVERAILEILLDIRDLLQNRTIILSDEVHKNGAVPLPTENKQ